MMRANRAPVEARYTMRILYVDDEMRMMRTVAALLEHIGASVAVFDDPILAATFLPLERWDVVLSDFSMPGMDGVDFLHEAARVCPRATRVLLTGSTMHPKVAAAFGDGLVDRVIQKGAPIATLLDALGLQPLPLS